MSRRPGVRAVLVLAVCCLLAFAVSGASLRSVREAVPYVVMTQAEAREVFGVGDRHGDDSIDAYGMEHDPATGTAWASMHTDDPRRARIDPADVHFSGDAASGDEGTIAVTLSRYDQPGIEAALDEVQRIVEESSLGAAFSYSPITDSISVIGDPALAPLLRGGVDGVAVTFSAGEVQLS